ncbi:MAG: acyltransferase [Halioglobus sp.]|nr:acyltransferase [Halioglobus sp.]
MSLNGQTEATTKTEPAGTRVHFNALDGLRGLMAIGVIVAHVNLEWFPGAHIMMDVFFVISAFLITFSLKRGIEKRQTIPLLNFWKRRLLRLYPALITVVVSYLLLASLIVNNMWPLVKDGLHSLLYISNFTKLHNYNFPHFFGHTWSLGIEEQFYLAWPIFLVCILKIDTLWKHRTFLMFAIIFFSATWRYYLYVSGAEWSRLYYGSETRIDAFVAGGLLAFHWDDLVNFVKKNRFNLLVFQSSIVALSAAVIFWDTKASVYFAWQQPVVLLLSSAVIVLLTHNGNGVLQRFFSHRHLTALGVRCYGLYLWHWPLIWLLLGYTDLSKLAILVIVLPVTFILTWLMYKYIEEPILKRR